MADDRTFSNPLYRLYTQYVGEPRSKKDVYGYWVLLLGYLFALLGILTFLFGPTSQTAPGAFVFREAAYTLAALGLPFGLLGIVLMLPVRRWGIVTAVLGVLISVGAVYLFTTLYPNFWALAASGLVWIDVAAYALGVGLVAGVAALVPVVTGERSALVETPAPEAEEGQADILLGETDRDGVFAVFQSATANWEWRLIDEEAIADGGETFASRIETEDAVERTRGKIGDAGLLEINHPAFRLYEDEETEWHWLLVDADGAVIARGQQAFGERDAAEASVSQFKEYGPDATLLTVEGAAFDYYREGDRWRWRLLDEDRSVLLQGPDRYESVESARAVTDRIAAEVEGANIIDMDPYAVELYDEDGTWRWRLLENEEPIATSDGTYESRTAVENAAHEVIDEIEYAAIRDTTIPGYEITEAQVGDWEWRLLTAGSEVVATSHEPVLDPGTAEEHAATFRDGAMGAEAFFTEETSFETYPEEGEWYWRLVDEARTPIAVGQTAYPDAESAEEAIDRIRELAPGADLIEFEKAAFQIYEAGDGDWRWRLIDEDGDVLADSGEDYFSRGEAASAMNTVKEYAPDADLIEIETAAFEFYQDDEGLWYWRLIDETGELLARAGEGYPSRQATKNAMNRLIDSSDQAPTREMDGPGFQVYAADADWAWRFVTVDNRIVADGTTTYTTRDQAMTAVESIREPADSGEITVVEDLLVDLVERDDEWRWRVLDADRDRIASGVHSFLTKEEATAAVQAVMEHAEETIVFDIEGAAFKLAATNGETTFALIDEEHDVLGQSPGDFADTDEARTTVERVRQAAPEAGSIEFQEAAVEVYQGTDGWRWRLIDERHRVIAEAADPCDTREAATAEVETVVEMVMEASILEIDTSAFELHEDDGRWHWQLIDENGQSLGRSLGDYPTREAAREAMMTFKELGSDARVAVADYE